MVKVPIKGRKRFIIAGILLIVVALFIQTRTTTNIYINTWTYATRYPSEDTVAFPTGEVPPSVLVSDGGALAVSPRSWAYLSFELRDIPKVTSAEFQVFGVKKVSGTGCSDRMEMYITSSFDIDILNWRNKPEARTWVASSVETERYGEGIKYIFASPDLTDYINKNRPVAGVSAKIYFAIRGNRDEGTATNNTWWILTKVYPPKELEYPRLILTSVSGGAVFLQWVLLIGGIILLLFGILRIAGILAVIPFTAVVMGSMGNVTEIPALEILQPLGASLMGAVILGAVGEIKEIEELIPWFPKMRLSHILLIAGVLTIIGGIFILFLPFLPLLIGIIMVIVGVIMWWKGW